jgi:polar amino acid transport system substrate-binding protein
LAFALLAGPAVCEPLRIGTEADYAPYIFHDETGALTGLDKDLGDALCAGGGWDCTWVETGFNDLIPGLVAGEFDAVIAGIGVNPGRLQLVDFTQAYVSTGQNIGVFAGLSSDLTVETARIAVLAGSNQEAHLTKTGRTFIPYPSAGACIDALVAGDVDLVFGTGTYFQDVYETGLTDLQEIASEEFVSLGTAIAVGKGNTALRDRMNVQLAAMQADGRLETLVTKWFPDAAN